ncbi:MAG: ABC transporter ATP-binding protein [Bacteriovoracaceae bacterium]|nr:ABC transporter ATP-binding protein [Bacteriovoracaceae bacterium]
MITFENVSKVFKTDLLSQSVHALNDVSFSIPSGAMVGFLGANGAGKTTSIKILLDFIRADMGTVHYGSEIGGSFKKALNQIGFLPERPYFYPHLTGREFAFFVGELSGLTRDTIKNQIKSNSEILHIDHALDRPLRSYSKGMLQRLGFMAVLLHRPKLIILDEPLSGLDPIGRKEFKDVLRKTNEEGTTIFFSSHVVPDVEESCDNVVFLRSGKLVYQGSVDKVIQDNVKPSFLIKIPNGKFEISTALIKSAPMGPELTLLEVTQEKQNSLIQELVHKNISILGVEQTRLSLEDIFYNIKSEK